MMACHIVSNSQVGLFSELKTDSGGKPGKFKARWVARSFEPRPEIGDSDTDPDKWQLHYFAHSASYPGNKEAISRALQWRNTRQSHYNPRSPDF